MNYYGEYIDFNELVDFIANKFGIEREIEKNALAITFSKMTEPLISIYIEQFKSWRENENSDNN
ncbi:TPA: hypothetical protein ACQ2HY_003300 [Klebsiella pneumoniae]